MLLSIYCWFRKGHRSYGFRIDGWICDIIDKETDNVIKKTDSWTRNLRLVENAVIGHSVSALHV
jgi:hypothetical protein